MDSINESLIKDLRANATEDAAAMSDYMRKQFIFLGIKSPARRKITQPYFTLMKGTARQRYKIHPQAEIIDWALVYLLWDQEEREFQYAAADYLKEMKHYLKDDDLIHLKQLITWKSWWDSVDALVKTIGYLAAQFPRLKQDLIEWSLADNIWLRRTAIINQLNMKDGVDLELLSTTIQNNLNEDEFFINKAIGWALRDYSKTNPQWVHHFLEVHRQGLTPLSLREASKYLDG